MNIFRKREVCEETKAYPPYWSEHDFSRLTHALTSDRPHLGFEINNVSQRFGLGVCAASHYRSNELSLNGRMTAPTAAAFECEFCVLPDEFNEREYHGYVTLESRSPPGGKLYPKFLAKYNVRSDEEIERLRRAIQPAMCQTGSLYVTFILQRITNVQEWISEFSKNNYAPSIAISGLLVSTSLYDKPL